MIDNITQGVFNLSLSARRAWIEITVDEVLTNEEQVALRKESVDRNRLSGYLVGVYTVALRKESVDRNQNCCPYLSSLTRSLSARRAWIEITVDEVLTNEEQVALRKESVDRNCSRRR